MTAPTTPATEPQKPAPTPGADQQPEQLGVKDVIAAQRAAIESGETPSEATNAEAMARELLAPGRSYLQAVNDMVSRGVLVNDAKAALRAAAENPAPATPPDETAPNPLVVTLDDGTEIELPSPEVASQVRESVMRREEFASAMAEIGAYLDQREAFEDALANDHVGALWPRYASSPARAAELARHLLAIPGVREAVDGDVRDDTEVLAVMGQRQRQAEAQLNQVAAARQYHRQVIGAVSRATQGLSGQAAELAHVDLLRDIAAAVRQNNNRPIALEALPKLLEARLQTLGIDLGAAAAAFSSTAPAPMRRPATTAGPDAEEARTAGAKLKQRGDERRAAAAVPGAGAGARPTKLEPPAERHTVKERLAWLREKWGR